MTFPPGGQPYSEAQPVQQVSSNHRGPRRTGLIVGLSVLAVAVLGGGTATAVYLNGKESATTDNQRIESAIRDFYGTLSKQGPSVAVQQACAADRAEFNALPASQKSAADQGKFTIQIVSVDKIAITGDRATAAMTGSLALAGTDNKTTTATEHLRKEDGSWKVCSADGK
ncbi:hypothetical protein AB0N05_23390 [Nocardia sp. NPDC051030]|uniref:Rv0361 family membrane protein n=1 Tax=Nocardia sp. NPDC051030 TaxID=3155162 RepID=UPI00342AD235